MYYTNFQVEFHNGALWCDGGNFERYQDAHRQYMDYKKRYGKAKLYEIQHHKILIKE
jgi:hypothetical protein